MTISRDNIADYLNEQFSALASAVGQSSTPLTGYKPDIDGALRKLGKTESELEPATVEDANRDAYFALAEYYAARRLWRQLGDRVDNTDGLTAYKFDGQRKQAKEIMEDAASRLAVLGYDVTGSGWTVGWFNQDFLEPESAL